MRLAAIFFAFVTAGAAARAAECRLSHADCVVIARELAMNDRARERDEDALASLPPYQRGAKVMDLEYRRLRARARVLPVRLGNELARMKRCDAERRAAAASGRAADPASC